MGDPIIPNIPQGSRPEEISFFSAIKNGLEFLLGHGRNEEDNRAVRVGELEKIKLALASEITKKIEAGEFPSTETPDPPRNLIVTKGIFVHNLTWENPNDDIVSHIEIWAAEGSQHRDDALLVGIVTVTKDQLGKQGHFTHSGFDVTKDMTYWIRSVSFANYHSVWCPPDDQGGYVVPGEESIEEFTHKILDLLTGKITENELYIDLSQKIDKIEVNETAIREESVIREEADTALAHSVSTVQAKVNNNQAAIKAERTARISGDNALAQEITTVQTTVGQHTTSIQANAVSINGIKGKYTIKIDNNGYVTGYGLLSDWNNGAPISEFIVLVDNFKIVTPGKRPRVPFVVGTIDGLSTVGINGQLVVDGSIYGNKIRAGTITAQHLHANQLLIGHTIRSANFSNTNRTGWEINRNGHATFYGGKITIGPGSDGFQNLTDRPTTLQELDSIAGNKLNGIQENADVTSLNKSKDTWLVAGESAVDIKQWAAAGYNLSTVIKPWAKKESIKAALHYETIMQGGYINTYFIETNTLAADKIVVNSIMANRIYTRAGLACGQLGSIAEVQRWLKALDTEITGPSHDSFNLWDFGENILGDLQGRQPIISVGFEDWATARKHFLCIKERHNKETVLVELWAYYGNGNYVPPENDTLGLNLVAGHYYGVNITVM